MKTLSTAPKNPFVAPRTAPKSARAIRGSKLARLATLWAVGTTGLFGFDSAAHAAPIFVQNFSFEDDIAADGATNPTISGWDKTGDVNTQNPGSLDFIGAADQGTPTGGERAQSVQFSRNLGQSFIQSASALTTVTRDSIYIINVSIGDNLQFEPGNLRVGFLIDGSFVNSATVADRSFIDFNGSNVAPEGTFNNFSFSYVTQNSDVGKTLKIALGKLDGDSVNFDNVRLDVQPVPEPSTWAMMFLGMGAMGLVMRRKREMEA